MMGHLTSRMNPEVYHCVCYALTERPPFTLGFSFFLNEVTVLRLSGGLQFPFHSRHLLRVGAIPSVLLPGLIKIIWLFYLEKGHCVQTGGQEGE